MGRIGEFFDRLAPGAVEQRGDWQGGGDAIAHQVGEGIGLLERELLARQHLVGAGIDIVLRPDAPFQHRGLVVVTEDGGVEVRQGIQINEARPQQCLAVINAPRHWAGVATPNEHDHAIVKNDLAMFNQAVLPVAMPDDPARRHQDRPDRSRLRLGQVHGLVRTQWPYRATTRPCLTTRRRSGRATAAWVMVSPATTIRSARAPTWSP